jgi:hypothetical protein
MSVCAKSLPLNSRGASLVEPGGGLLAEGLLGGAGEAGGVLGRGRDVDAKPVDDDILSAFRICTGAIVMDPLHQAAP